MKAIYIITCILFVGILGYAVLKSINDHTFYTPGYTNNPSPTTPSTNNPSTTTPVGNEKIKINTLKINSVISSPLVITGEAKGWYFEASFPVTLLDGNGKIIAQGPAQAQSDWMTSEFVPFKITLTFPTPQTATGTLLFQNDNPSGLPEHSEEFRLPITFASSNASTTQVSLYYPNSNKAVQLGDPCNAGSVIHLTSTVARSLSPIKDTLNLLIAGNITTQEKAQGFTTEFPNTQFKLLGATLKNGVLALEFTEVPGFTSGGSCRVGILKAQIEKTALQFPGVTSVVIKPNTIFQP